MYCGVCHDEPCSCDVQTPAPHVLLVTPGAALASTIHGNDTARREAAANFRSSAKILNEAADIMDPG
jgi:hypothetical protein